MSYKRSSVGSQSKQSPAAPANRHTHAGGAHNPKVAASVIPADTQKADEVSEAKAEKEEVKEEESGPANQKNEDKSVTSPNEKVNQEINAWNIQCRINQKMSLNKGWKNKKYE